jgi:hypothetical protein
MERGILRAGVFGQHLGFRAQASQSCLLALIFVGDLPRAQLFAARAGVEIALVVVDKVGFFEGNVAPFGLVEHRDAYAKKA